jgi:oligosaccharyltransferase complex subunit gamma
MKFNIALLACSALSLAVSISTAQELSSRLAKFHSLAAKNGGIVPLTSALYEELIADSPSNPRDYTTSIVLTALNPRFGCQPCITFDKEHKEVAKQWWNRRDNRKSKQNQMRHVFAVLDFEKGQDVFKRVRIVLASSVCRDALISIPRARASLIADGTQYSTIRTGVPSKSSSTNSIRLQ